MTLVLPNPPPVPLTAAEIFERGALNYLVKHPNKFRVYEKQIGENFFTDLTHRMVYTVISKCIRESSEVPTLSEIVRLVGEHSDAQHWPSAHKTAAIQSVIEIWETDFSFVTGQALRQEFVARERLAIIEALENTSPTEFVEKIPELVMRINDLRHDQGDFSNLGLSVFSARNQLGGFERATTLVDDMYGKAVISTGYPLLDGALLGGVRLKEVLMIMAFIGTGKTFAALNLACNIVHSDKRVVMFATDNTVEELADRALACYSGIAIKPTRVLETYRKELLSVIRLNERFIIMEWAPGRHRVDDIKHHIDLLQSAYLRQVDIEDGRPEPGRVDVVVTDSADLLVSSLPAKADRWERLAAISEEQVTLAKELGVAVISTTQGNRMTDAKPNLAMSDVAESIGKLRPVSNVIGIAQSGPEKTARQFRWQLLKLRRPDGVNKYVRMFFNPFTQQIIEDPAQTKLKNMYRPDGSVARPEDKDDDEDGAPAPAPNPVKRNSATTPAHNPLSNELPSVPLEVQPVVLALSAAPRLYVPLGDLGFEIKVPVPGA